MGHDEAGIHGSRNRGDTPREGEEERRKMMEQSNLGKNLLDSSLLKWDDGIWGLNFNLRWLREIEVRIPVRGCALERIQEYYNFVLGTKLAGIGELKAGMSRAETVVHLYPAFEVLGPMIQNKFKWFPMCAASGITLVQIMAELMPLPPPSSLSPPDQDTWRLSTYDVTRIREAAKAFDNSLSIQFDEIDVYRVMPKGTHDTRKLIEQPELHFESLWQYLGDLGKTDWTSGSRCLAFDLPTACGFHCLRAMEATVIQYLDAKKEPRPKRDLGEYVKSLRKIGADDAAISIVDHLRGHHRNPLMHPTDTLDVAEALLVYGLSGGAITCLLKDMLAKGVINP